MQLLLFIMKITIVQIEDCIIELGEKPLSREVFLLLSLEVFAETREYNPPPPQVV